MPSPSSSRCYARAPSRLEACDRGVRILIAKGQTRRPRVSFSPLHSLTETPSPMPCSTDGACLPKGIAVASSSKLAVAGQQQDPLQRLIAGLAKRVDARGTVLTPIQRMPTEVLGEILLFLTPDVLAERERGALLDLSLVCRGWRDASLFTHRLWSGIKIYAFPARPGPGSYNRIEAWLRRAGSVPKRLELATIGPGCLCRDGGQCFSTNPVLRRLLTEGPVLDSLTFPCRDNDCLRKWIAAVQPVGSQHIPTTWDRLKTLKLVVNSEPWRDSSDPCQSAFCHLPPVKSLHLMLPIRLYALNFRGQDLSIDVGVHIPPRVLAGLKSLTIMCDWSGTQVFDLLRHCTNLQYLEVDTDARSPWASPQKSQSLQALLRERLLLPHLVTLRIRFAEQIDFLAYVETPALQNLDLKCYGSVEDHEEAFWETLQDFIVASGLEEKLESLRLCDISGWTDGMDLAFAIHRLRNLRRLTLEGLVLPQDAFWRTLHGMAEPAPRGYGECFPRLRNVDFVHISSAQLYPFDDVARFLEKNNKGRPCQVTISYWGPACQQQSELDTPQARKKGIFFQVIAGPLSLWW